MVNSGVVKYIYIADTLKEQIINGEYRVGDAIPSENELTKIFNVSRHTIREAISLLVTEGFVRKEKGSGTYVSYNEMRNINEFNRGPIVGVITTYLSDYIFPSIIRGIESELNKANVALLLASTHNNYNDEKKAIRKMIDSGVDGLIIEPTKSSFFNPNTSLYLELKSRGIPFILINSVYNEFDSNYVIVDDIQSGMLATEYLIERGHKKILAIMKIDDKQGNNRLRGFVDAHAKHNLSISSDSIITFETENKGQVSKLLEDVKINEFTAIVCYNDEIGIQTNNYLRSKGLSVPGDISIVSHDDSSLSDNAIPHITSVSHPKEKLGIEASKWIIKAIQAKSVDPAHIMFETKIVEKQSVLILD